MCKFTAKLNLYVGELGYYQFKECGDMNNPTLGMEFGKRLERLIRAYEFVQEDPLN